jgi:hypothetical protein
MGELNPVTPWTDEFGRADGEFVHVDDEDMYGGMTALEWAVLQWRNHGAVGDPMPTAESLGLVDPGQQQ